MAIGFIVITSPLWYPLYLWYFKGIREGTIFKVMRYIRYIYALTFVYIFIRDYFGVGQPPKHTNIFALIAIVWLLCGNFKPKKLTDEDFVNQRLGKDGFTKLMGYASLGNNELIENNQIEINLQDKKGYTALMYASSNGKYDTVKLLLEYGADVSIETTKGNKALDFAVKNKHTDIVSLLKKATSADTKLS
jgi:hypothetical protein